MITNIPQLRIYHDYYINTLSNVQISVYLKKHWFGQPKYNCRPTPEKRIFLYAVSISNFMFFDWEGEKPVFIGVKGSISISTPIGTSLYCERDDKRLRKGVFYKIKEIILSYICPDLKMFMFKDLITVKIKRNWKSCLIQIKSKITLSRSPTLK